MLTARENFDAAIRGGQPDRFVNQYEALRICIHPALMHMGVPMPGTPDIVNAWGVTYSWPLGAPGPYPVHNPKDLIVIKDIEDWKEYVKAPSLDFPDAEWDMLKAVYDSVDTSLAYKTVMFSPGIFELCHHLGEISETMVNLIMYEDEMKDLIKYITEHELKMAEQICERLKPECLFHHDDWGSRDSTFMDPNMFADYFVEPYKEIYGYFKSHGCGLIVHHSDSYGATLVDSMIEMGIDVWQGCMSTNNIPELNKKYKGKIAFMGGFDGADFDLPDLTEADVRRKTREILDANDPSGFIPCIAQGGPGSCVDGVYETIMDEIDTYNAEKFGHKKEEIKRSPMQLEKLGFM